MLNVYLPGYSQSNEATTAAIGKKFRKRGYHIYPRYWQHWQDKALEANDFDFELEIANLNKVLLNFKNAGIGVMAKSIGSALAVKWVAQTEFKLVYVMLMGIPTDLWREISAETKQQFVQKLKDTQTPLIILQNNADPYGPAAETKANFDKLVAGSGINYEFKELEAADHVYNDPPFFADLVAKYQDQS